MSKSNTHCKLRRHRWVKTGPNVWQYESSPRRFHGCVRPSGDQWSWHTGYGQPYDQGIAPTRREAMGCVVRHRAKAIEAEPQAARDRYNTLLRQCGFRSWKRANHRRGELIDLDQLTPRQAAELDQLQELADALIDLIAPIPQELPL